jgi:hypothetical protein
MPKDTAKDTANLAAAIRRHAGAESCRSERQQTDTNARCGDHAMANRLNGASRAPTQEAERT